jgi:hypothetical protein
MRPRTFQWQPKNAMARHAFMLLTELASLACPPASTALQQLVQLIAQLLQLIIHSQHTPAAHGVEKHLLFVASCRTGECDARPKPTNPLWVRAVVLCVGGVSSWLFLFVFMQQVTCTQ